MPEAVYARISMAYALASAVLPENCRKDARSRVLVRGVQVRDSAMKWLRPVQTPTKVVMNRCRVSVRSCAVTSGSRWDVAGWGIPSTPTTSHVWNVGRRDSAAAPQTPRCAPRWASASSASMCPYDARATHGRVRQRSRPV